MSVEAREAARARRLLAARDLPRAEPPGFAAVFGKGGVIPSASEEQALYLLALAGELERTARVVDGVLEARVHVAMAPPDPLRAGGAPASASVLLKVRPGSSGQLAAFAPELRRLVAGALPALQPEAVALVVTEAREAAEPPPREAAQRPRAVLLGLLAAALAVATLLLPRRAALRQLLQLRPAGRRR